MRPILRPGTHLLRRDDKEMQLGLDPQQAVVLSDDAAVRGCLAKLGTAAALAEFATDSDTATLELLADNDLLVDSDRLLPLIPSCPTGSVAGRKRTQKRPAPRGDAAALARVAGDEAPALLRARQLARVHIVAFGCETADPPAAELRALLTRAGLGLAASGPDPDPASLVVLVGVGEPHREVLDPWLRAGAPHLLVRLAEGRPTVGPFVVPGETACLRCIDAHHTDADPCWPLLVTQYAECSGRDRADGVPEPVDSLVASVAVAWAAREVASFVEGRRPATWSSTIRFDPWLTSLESRSWPRHPMCGCAWG